MALGIVKTKYGEVQGVVEEGVLVFKGVPYAAPPVGDLRWKPPVDPAPWEGVRHCDTYGPRPVQPTFYGGSFFEPWASDFYYMGYTAYSEDCLYLNIATDAESAGEKRPVYMWFHGGGLSSGYSYEVEFNPTVLAKKGVIVVSVGQRLNVFGYLSLPQLSAEQGGISGNYGLMDEVKALDWVRENIAAFGGDPDNITIGGQSGGTAKTGGLARCPKASGKIKRVINQSSLNWLGTYATMKEAEAEGVAFIKSLGFKEDATLEELRAADAEVFNTSGKPFDPNVARKPGNMVCDGVWVPEQDMAVSFDKYAGNLDYLAGGNLGECVMAPGFVMNSSALGTAKEFYEAAKEMVGEELYNKYDFENTFPVEDADANKLARRLAVEGLTGFSGNMKNLYFGEYRAKKFPGAKTYTYVFSHFTPGIPDDKKNPLRDPDIAMAWHSAELWYTFASLRVGKNGASNVPPIRPWTEYDVQLADLMSSYWANFMKTGNPNGEGLPYWPESRENYGWIDLGDEIVAHEGLESKKDQLLHEFLLTEDDLPKA